MDKWINEIRAFERWLDTSPLSGTAQLLWYKLMYLNNSCMWDEWFAVDNLRLMALIRVSNEKTVITAREKLIEAGLIEYKKGKKGSPGRYHMISLYCNFYSTNDRVFDSRHFSVTDIGNDSLSYSHNRYRYIQEKDFYDDGDDGACARENGPVDVERLFGHYFGRRPTPAELEGCGALMRVHDPALVESAFAQSAQMNQLNLAYVRGVLCKFSERGIRTEEDEAAYDLSRH